MEASCNKICFHCTETRQEVAEMKHKIILVFIVCFNVDYKKNNNKRNVSQKPHAIKIKNPGFFRVGTQNIVVACRAQCRSYAKLNLLLHGAPKDELKGPVCNTEMIYRNNLEVKIDFISYLYKNPYFLSYPEIILVLVASVDSLQVHFRSFQFIWKKKKM